MVVKPTEINYINTKKYNQLIKEDNEHTVIIASSDIREIKKTISGILDCTNFYKEIKTEAEGRKIFSINEDITKHMFSSISNNSNNEEKKEIIKEQLKKIINSKNNIVIFFRNKKIYIIDTGIEEKKISKEIRNKRYDGYTDEEVDFLIKENLGENYDSKEILIKLLDNIKLSKFNKEESIQFITNEYKGYLLNGYIEELEKDYNIPIEILKAIAGKLLRKNFLLAKEYIITDFFYEKLKNILENQLDKKEIEIKIKENIKNYFLKNIKDNFFNIHILENIDNYYYKIIEKIIKKELSIQNIKLDDFQINKITKEYIKSILNKKRKEIIKEIFQIITNEIIENINSKDKIISKNINSIFFYLSKEENRIYIQNHKKFYNIANFISILKKNINEEKEYIKKQKIVKNKLKQYENKKKDSIEKLEKQLNSNIKEISQLFNSLKENKETYTTLTIEELKDKVQSLRNNNHKNSQKIKSYKSNILRQKLYLKNIQKLNIKNENNSKKIELLLKIIKLKSLNQEIKNKIIEYKNKKEEIKKINNEINELNKEIKKIEENINIFKYELTNFLIKTFSNK